MTSARLPAPVAGRTARLVATGRLLDGVVIVVAVGSVARVWWQPVPPRLQVTALTLLATLPLLARRRLPFLAPLGGLLGCLGLGLLVPGALWEQLQFFFCALLCAWTLGSENRPRPAAAGLVVALAVAVVTVEVDPVHSAVGDYVFAVVIVGAAWTAGALFGVRARQAAASAREAERLSAERDRQAAEAVAQERARIARELHDVIAHTVSVMVVQAGAAEHVLPEGNQQVRTALHAIRESGKGALAELRRLLGLLQDDSSAEPAVGQPGLEEVGALVARMAGAGADVRLETTGPVRSVPPGLDQAAYRIVQEALTNTLKHAAGARTTVVFRWKPGILEIDVSDDGVGCPSAAGHIPGGRGILGMRERARLYGGELEAGPRPEGGFRVAVRLPT